MKNPVRKSIDLLVTTILWVYFIFGFLVFFLPFYLAAYVRKEGRELRYQHLHHLFFRGFFGLTRFLIPSLTIEVDPQVRDIRSAILVCNHISYLDPLLMIAAFKKQKTIVKSTFFSVPVFGWLMKHSGYVPAVGKGVSPWEVLHRIMQLGDYLTTGGNVFVFPEGTRSRTGEIGTLARGAFEVALRSRATIKVLLVENSNDLFRPGTFLFNTAIDRPIRLKLVETLNPDYEDEGFSVEALMETVKELLDRETGCVK